MSIVLDVFYVFEQLKLSLTFPYTKKILTVQRVEFFLQMPRTPVNVQHYDQRAKAEVYIMKLFCAKFAIFKFEILAISGLWLRSLELTSKEIQSV